MRPMNGASPFGHFGLIDCHRRTRITQLSSQKSDFGAQYNNKNTFLANDSILLGSTIRAFNIFPHSPGILKFKTATRANLLRIIFLKKRGYPRIIWTYI